jgi:hypothetical protein
MDFTDDDIVEEKDELSN